MPATKEERVVEIIVNGQKANASLKEMGAAAAVLSNQVAKIAADDPRRAELIAELQTMRQRIADTRAEIGGLLTAQQQAAAATQQLAEAQAAEVAEQQRAIAAGKASTASYNEMKAAAGLLERQLHGLGADDENRAALLTDLQTLRGRLEEARTALGGVIQTEAQQRAEAEALRQAEQALTDTEARRQRELAELVVNGQRVYASMREMRGAAAELERQLDELGQDDPARGPLIAALRELRARIHDVQQEVVGVTETTSHMKQVMAYAFGSLVGGGIEGVLDKLVETGKEVFNTSAKFEKYSAILTNTLGSESLAQKALADIKQLAKDTPFSVDELTESFLKLVNRGVQPSMAEMQNLADLAASQGKSFDQLAEAVLDAGTGEFERLKELGISASKSGDQVTLSFKGVQQTVANTPQAITAALVAFGDAKGVAGSTAVVMGTLEGQLSNVGDTADQTAVAWGTALRPAFVAVLSTVAFLLGALGALPGLLRENRGVLLALAAAAVALNVELVEFNLLLLLEAARTKAGLVWKWASKVATDAWTASQTALNVALTANPIGAVIAAILLLVGVIMLAYDKSERFRAAVRSLWQMFDPLLGQVKELWAQLEPLLVRFEKWWASLGTGKSLMEMFGQLVAVQVILPLKLLVANIQLTVDALTGLWDAGKRVANFFGASFKVAPRGWFADLREHSKANALSIGKTLLGLDPAQGAQDVKDYTDVINAELRKASAAHYAAWQAEQAAARAARLEALKNEEAALKERLAKTRADSEAEMRLKQQLVTNKAKQELEDEKKTAAERRVILAEAEGDRVKLAQEYWEKRGKARKAAHDKKVADDLKERLADIEAERLHQEMLAQVRQAAVALRGDALVTEMSAIYTEGQVKIAALEANTKKELAQLVGSAEQKKDRTRDLEQKLAADRQLVQQEVQKKQGELFEKHDKEETDRLRKSVQDKLDILEEEAAREQAAYETPLNASFRLQQEYEELRYQARQRAFTRELDLIEQELGMQSEEFRRVASQMEKDQRDHHRRQLTAEQQLAREKRQLLQAGTVAAADALGATLDMLDQDGKARQEHHGLYMALATAKIIMDGIAEVQAIWLNANSNWLNTLVPGWGPAWAGVQTGLAVARTGMALSQLHGASTAEPAGYAQGGATGTGAGLAGSGWGQLLLGAGMRVGSDGRLHDGSGFAVAGVVHEDEYVIPKWQLQDPQVAAVTQWLEARRVRGITDRGFADGGPTSARPGAALPVAAASPASDGEKLYAVLVQMLGANQAMVQQLGDVARWQREFQVVNDLRGQLQQVDEYKQVRHQSAIRSKNSPSN